MPVTNIVAYPQSFYTASSSSPSQQGGYPLRSTHRMRKQARQDNEWQLQQLIGDELRRAKTAQQSLGPRELADYAQAIRHKVNFKA